MSRVDVVADVRVYEKDDSEWGWMNSEKLRLETYWNDDIGDYAVLVIGEHRYTVAAKDLRVALDAVTRR